MSISQNISLLYVASGKRQDPAYCRQLKQHFDHIIAVTARHAACPWVRELTSEQVCYGESEGKVHGLNRALKKVDTPFAMLLEQDERCKLQHLPRTIEDRSCYRALITEAEKEQPKQNYQLRIFPVQPDSAPFFEGFHIPDLTRRFTAGNWKLSEKSIPIQKYSPLYDSEVIEEEAEWATALKKTFWKAHLQSEMQHYAGAEDNFRRLLRDEQLLEHDYLAALNGLAHALTEQHKLQAAALVARQSLQKEKQQRVPYLLLFKIYQLSGEVEKCYETLTDYLEICQETSRANMDVYLSEEECHFLLAENMFQKGDYDRAFIHYETFYDLNNGDIGQAVLEKLFIYAIELENYRKSVKYFYEIFGDHIPDNLDDDMSARLLESLSLFKDNGWYSFVNDIYEELVAHNPDDNRLLHGWISTLIKNEQIEKAQSLLN
ncbi:tetratricopeptide repeat protein [Fodinibius sediminis]|uniref:Tetratricopeptide repeat-containing protein n=1 Tax=Fodinibius sediminis TaxID=1214077 RepID=A0A521CH24_9BACT|nr:hypothetical protein [Fodinibius sediminis]SMO58724.1 hypothetical protein SAMN06265218_10682 [Fodinibius sediminis]